MSLTPKEIPTGAVRYNTDSNKMEVYIGDTWMEVAVSSPNLGDSSSPAGTRGLFFGEFDDSSNTPTIDYVTISSTGNAVDYGDLINSVQFYGGACSSHRRWIYFGGAPGNPTNQMQFGEISTTGNGTDFGDCVAAITNARGGNCGNAVRGLMVGGSDGASNTIQYVTISTLGNTVDFGDRTVAKNQIAHMSSTTRGVFAGAGAKDTNVADYVQIMSTGNAIDFGDLSANGSSGYGWAAGASNGHGGL